MKTKSFFDLNIFILKVSGLWIPDQNESFLLKCMYFVWDLTLVCFSVIFLVAMEVLALRFTYHNIEDLMKNISVAGTHVLGVLKVIIWFYNRKEILAIMKVMENKVSEYEPINDFEPIKLIATEKKIKNYATRIFLCLGLSVSISAYAAAMWVLLTDYKKYEKVSIGPNNITSYQYTQKLPYHMEIPFAYYSSRPLFALTLIYNCIPAFHFAGIIIGIDTIFTSLVSFINAHLKVLEGAFRTIRPKCLHVLRMSTDPVLHDSEELSAAMKKEMSKCVEHLQLIFRISKQVENMFTYLIFIQVLSSQILICTCLYNVSSVPITSKAFTTELVYLLAIEMQIGLYCFFGNKVTLTGDNISLALYGGDWLSSDTSFKKSMLITMTRMRHPIYFTIGKFCPLTLATFVTIGRASYSFFAVIKSCTA